MNRDQGGRLETVTGQGEGEALPACRPLAATARLRQGPGGKELDEFSQALKP